MKAVPVSLPSILRDKANLFVLKMALVYVSWKLVHAFFFTPSALFYNQWLVLVHYLGIAYAAATNAFLQNIGEATVLKGNEIYFTNLSSKIKVSELCLAIPAMYIFSFCILLFSGSVKNKCWFIPLGLAGIAFINVVRLVLLSFIFAHYPSTYFMFHHSVSFVLFTYGIILWLVFIWMKHFSGLTPSSTLKTIHYE